MFMCDGWDTITSQDHTGAGNDPHNSSATVEVLMTWDCIRWGYVCPQDVGIN